MTEALARQRAAAAGQKIGLAARIRRYADTRSGLAIALGSGALAAFALPPFYLVPLLLISLPILLWLLAGASGPMRAGRSPQEACELAVARVNDLAVRRGVHPAHVAFLALDPKGRTGAACTSQTNFQYAVGRPDKSELLKATELAPKP